MRIVHLNAIEEALRVSAQGAVLYLDSEVAGRPRAIADQARRSGVPIHLLSRTDLQNLVRGQDCRGLVLEMPGKAGIDWSFDDLSDQVAAAIEAGQKPLVVALDSITDPHNLGAIVRSADQFGALAVVVPERRSAQDGPILQSTSAGAINWVPLVSVKNLVRGLEQLKEVGLWCIGAAMEGEAVHERKLDGPTLLVMGSEGKGLSPLVARTCDELVRVPTQGRVDSLNVSNACAVLLYELRRQQGFRYQA